MFLALLLHVATLYYQNAQCVSSSPCTLVVYRAQCASATNCPAWGNGQGWIRPPSATLNILPTVSANGTTWIVTDKDPALKDNTTYVYAATDTWSSGSPVSNPSPLWSGTTSAGTPSTPTVGSGNSVN